MKTTVVIRARLNEFARDDEGRTARATSRRVARAFKMMKKLNDTKSNALKRSSNANAHKDEDERALGDMERARDALNDVLRATANALNEERNARARERGTAKEMVDAMEETIEGLKAELREERGKKGDGARTREREDVERTHARALEKALEERRAEFEGAEGEYRGRIIELEARLAHAEAGEKFLAEANEELSGKTRDLQTRLEEARGELAAKSEEALNVEAAMMSATRNLQEELTRVKEDVQLAEATSASLETHVASLRAELEAKSRALEIAVAASTSGVEEVERDLSRARAAVESSQFELRGKTEALAVAEASTLEVKRELESALIDRRSLELQLEAAKQQAQDTGAELHAKNQAFAMLEKSSRLILDEKGSEFRRVEQALTSELQGALASRQTLEKQISDLLSELQLKSEALEAKSEALERAEALSASAEDAESVRQSFENQMAALESQLRAKHDAMESAEAHVVSLRETAENQLAETQMNLQAKIAALAEAEANSETAARDANAARLVLENQVAAMQSDLQNKTELIERYEAMMTDHVALKSSLNEANERLIALQDEIKHSAARDASAAEALALAERDAAKAKDNVASIASASATQFAQERQMMKNALGELQTERDILVKMLKTFQQHGSIHSTSGKPEDDSFVRRFSEAPSLASVFTPRSRAEENPPSL